MKFLIDLEFTPTANERPFLVVWLIGPTNLRHRVLGIEKMWPAELQSYFVQMGDLQFGELVPALIEDDRNGNRDWPKFTKVYVDKIRKQILESNHENHSR